MSEVRLANVAKYFGRHAAVNDVSITFHDRKFTVLVGPSGCGKSTLLRLIAGLEHPTNGQVFIGDRSVNEVPVWQRNVAMVFQSYALYPHLTVRENLAFPLRAQKYNRQQIDQRVSETAGRLEIADLLDRLPRQLSGGQMQRVAIGRSLVRRPEAFLMDEPLSNLDAILRVDMRAEIKRLHREVGSTTIYVTHDQEEALTLAETLVVLREGQIEQMGPPQEVYDRPRTAFVAGFLGNPPANLLSAQYDAGSRQIVGRDFRYDVPAEKAGLHASQEVLLGIRPEHIRLVPKRAGHCFLATGRVDLTESLGRQVLITVLVADKRVKAFAPIDNMPHVGQPVWLDVDQDRLLVFDRQSGQRV
jgi:ABC-type sugar transport system ATPase subunit